MADDPHLIAIVRDAGRIARDEGLDHIGQVEVAVLAVRVARPAMTASEAMTLVQRVWDRPAH